MTRRNDGLFPFSRVDSTTGVVLPRRGSTSSTSSSCLDVDEQGVVVGRRPSFEKPDGANDSIANGSPTRPPVCVSRCGSLWLTPTGSLVLLL